jgi:flagellar FliL protein
MSEAPAAPAPKAGKKKLIVVALVALLVAGGGGGAAWFFLGQKAAPEGAQAKKKAVKPLFTTLEPFTVNLQDPRGERFAQIGVTLQFEDPKLEMELKDRLPAVRNEILLLISSKEIEELLTTEGKQKLAEEIRARSAHAMGIEVAAAAAPGDKAAGGKEGKGTPNPIQSVLFSQFIVQ